MLGLLLASSIAINCTVVNFHPQPTLTCSDDTVRRISYFGWPREWHGPELGFTYTLVDGKPVVSVRDEEKAAEQEQKSRNEQLRWMRPPTQRSTQ